MNRVIIPLQDSQQEQVFQTLRQAKNSSRISHRYGWLTGKEEDFLDRADSGWHYFCFSLMFNPKNKQDKEAASVRKRLRHKLMGK
jgi:hypothetical protein